MAEYKHGEHLHHSNHTVFDTKLAPGSAAQNAGVYRCANCGDEIAIAKGHILPPQNHHQHAPGMGKIEWVLLVFAQQNK